MKAIFSTKCFQFLSFMLVTLMAFGLITCGGGGGGGGETTGTTGTTSPPTSTPTTSAGTINNAMAQIDSADTPSRLWAVSGDAGVQFASVETQFPEAATLISQGTASTPFIIPKFAGKPTFSHDAQLVIYSKVLAAINDQSAVRALTDFLDVNLTGDLLWSIDAATYALKVLTGQTGVHAAYPFYTAAEVIDAINQARAWLGANPGIPQKERLARSDQETTILQSCGRVNIILADDQGNPYSAVDPDKGGPPVPVQFNLRMYKDLTLSDLTETQTLTSDNTVTNGAGTPIAYLVEGHPEGDRNQTARFAICGGYALREALKRGPSKNVPWFGWNIDPTHVLHVLLYAGLIQGPKPISQAQEGDLVFWTNHPETDTKGWNLGNWVMTKMNHAAIVEKVGSGITVRNKNQLSSVFTADINAKYFTDCNFGTPYIFRFNGPIPTMLVDTSLSDKYIQIDTEPYLQNVRLTLSGPFPTGTKSILITATGDGLFKPFRKGFDATQLNNGILSGMLILPLGSKTIKAEATTDSISTAEQIGAPNPLSSASKDITLTDDNFFTPFPVTLALSGTPPPSYVIVDGVRYSILSTTCVLRSSDGNYVFNGSIYTTNLAYSDQGEVMISTYLKTPGQNTYSIWEAWWKDPNTGGIFYGGPGVLSSPPQAQ